MDIGFICTLLFLEWFHIGIISVSIVILMYYDYELILKIMPMEAAAQNAAMLNATKCTGTNLLDHLTEAKYL